MSITDNPASTRARQLRGLLDLTNFLAAHPQLPLPTAITLDLHAERDLDGFEAVARMAHRLGVTVSTSPNGTQRAVRRFGPISYAVTYHPMTLEGEL